MNNGSFESLKVSVRCGCSAKAFQTRESVSEVRSSRRKLTIPVVVVTGARGADENWRQLQQDLTSLSERGCLMIARQSAHVVSVDQPQVVVDAIRAIVDMARGQNDVSLCARIGSG
jgi:hypothetical protein